jgi:organic hydroperoxide reductase OsmC/OhrA
MAAVMPVGRLVNGLDMDELEDIAQEVRRDPGRGQVEFRARTEWRGRTRSRTMIDSYTVGGWQVHRHFTIDADQPFELQGRNTAPNPQELLMAALNACLTVAYVTQAALRGVTLEAVHIETAGSLDLRGVLGVDPARLRHPALCGAPARLRHARAVPRDPRGRGADVAQRLQPGRAGDDRRATHRGVNDDPRRERNES